MKPAAALNQNILDNMSEGVLAVDAKGRITIFNPSAGRILGMEEIPLAGENFAQALLTTEGNDSFNQALLDAVYEKKVGHTRIVELSREPETLFLRVTTSYLRATGSATGENLGIVVVFNDISDRIRREKELETTCRQLEQSNSRLDGALSRIRTMRRFAMAFALLLFAGGLFVWSRTFISIDSPATEAVTRGDDSIARTMVVQPRVLSSEIYLAGKLAPIEIVNVVSPMGGKVKEVFFSYGGEVEKGQPLLEMDVSAINVNLREARSAHIKALQTFNRLRDWENGPEVNSARRRLNKSRTTLEYQERALVETRMLFDQGIISKREHASAERQLLSMRLDHQSIQEELVAIQRRGRGDNLAVARLAADSAADRLKALEEQKKSAVVTAPVSGVVIRLAATEKDKAVRRGGALDQGMLILAIGNRRGLSIQTSIDEVDLPRLKTGQPVIATGDAFAGIRLSGIITAISSQATVKAGIPTFDVLIAIPELPPGAADRVRLGMSTRLAVSTQHKPDAILVPVTAVASDAQGTFVMRLRKDGGGVERVDVSTGITTPDAVEITRGLRPGDEVVYE